MQREIRNPFACYPVADVTVMNIEGVRICESLENAKSGKNKGM